MILNLKNYTLWLIMLILFGCSSIKPVSAQVVQTTFYRQLQNYCNQTVNGQVLYPLGQEAPFKGMPIRLEVIKCSQKEIRMPIYINDKVYRTLILTQDKNNYILRHENKRSDGTQAEISMYGGQTEGKNEPYLLFFPADGYSRQLMGAELKYAWSLAFNNDKSTLSYMIENDGKLTLQLDFDLTETLVKR